MIHQSVVTDFCRKQYMPEIDPTACIHPVATVVGHVSVGKRVMVSPFASVRGDEGQPIFVGDEANVQEGVIIHALETEHNGQPIEKNLVEVEGTKFAVHIGKRVSLAHQVQIHGPARVGDDTFVGMQTLVFKGKIGKNCVIEPGCIIMGVSIADERYVPAGTVLKYQDAADNLPVVTNDYPLKNLNSGVVHVNTSLADGYNKIELPQMIRP